MADVLHWFTITDHAGYEWPIFFADETEFRDLKKRYGVTFLAPARCIFLNILNSDVERDVVLFHEITHVEFSGIRSISNKSEETICWRMGGTIYRIVKSGGWSSPPMPDGYAQMRRRARRNIRKRKKA